MRFTHLSVCVLYYWSLKLFPLSTQANITFQSFHYASIIASDPCCTHTRKEHSLGVMMLSKKLAELIMEYQKKLGVTKMDVLCICMAGLCHDLGHGELRSKYF
jgi:hypothetical protein